MAAEAAEVGGDYWPAEIGSFDRSEVDHQTDIGTIIQDTDFRAKTYLRNIDALWRLGTKIYVPPKPAGDPSLEGIASIFADVPKEVVPPTRPLFRTGD